MRIFFSDDIDSCKLPQEEAQHACKVLRSKTGDSIHIIDGKGTLVTATITEIDKRKCFYTINKTETFTNPIEHLNIAVAPTKSSDRLEWMLEKMVEIGIGTIHLVHTERSECRKINIERIQKKIISAVKQSQKYFIPQLEIYPSLKDFIENTNFETKAMAHLIETERQYLGNLVTGKDNSCVLIGPEGDFTTEELEMATINNYRSVTLGDYRLRTETAAVFATTILNNSRYL